MVLLCGHTVPGRAWACLFHFQISAGRARAVPRAWVPQDQARPGPPKARPGRSLSYTWGRAAGNEYERLRWVIDWEIRSCPALPPAQVLEFVNDHFTERF